jgi:nucleoid-associated protein YgaU
MPTAVAASNSGLKPADSTSELPTTLPEKGYLSSESANREVSSIGGGKIQSSRVRAGDTLMKIAFEKYGNLYRWREIWAANRQRVRSFNYLTLGMVLQIHGVSYLVIEKNGKPYLIRKNDTLMKISNSLYGTPNYWRDLWQNNLQMIHNPNEIFYGFTMYYKDSLNKKSEPRIPANGKAL